MLSEQELKDFNDFWGPKVCNKRGLNKNKVIKELLEYKKFLEVEQVYDTCYISIGERLQGGVIKIKVVTPNNIKYNCIFNLNNGQFAVFNSKPLPPEWHQIVIDGIKKLLQSESKDAIVKMEK